MRPALSRNLRSVMIANTGHAAVDDAGQHERQKDERHDDVRPSRGRGLDQPGAARSLGDEQGLARQDVVVGHGGHGVPGIDAHRLMRDDAFDMSAED